jgi:hypothetical protein
MAKFEERFGIEVPVEEARKRFVNRVHLLILTRFVSASAALQPRYIEAIMVGLGKPPRFYPPPLREIVGSHFHDNLKAIEYIHRTGPNEAHREALDEIVCAILEESEVDLGVRWGNGLFMKAGAPLLDGKLVRDVLGWARNKKYETVVAPFEKGLRHFLESTKRPELLSDVVTDMYEALEAVAKIVTGRNVDLSSNRERFIKTIHAPEGYKKILKEYVDYGCDFRHAAEATEQKPTLLPVEVESFVYLTGIFIRFAMKAS